MNSNDKRAFNIIHKIIAVISCGALAYIYSVMYPYYFFSSLEVDTMDITIATILAAVVGGVLALLFVGDILGLFSTKVRDAVQAAETGHIALPVAEVVLMVLAFLMMGAMMIFMTIGDLFRVSGAVFFIYPLLFLLVFVNMGFISASKVKVIDKINLRRKMSKNAANPYMNPSMYQQNPQYPQYPQQGANQFPQYPQQGANQFPQYPQQAANQFSPYPYGNNDYGMPNGTEYRGQ